jgi:hypothetical protein
MPIPTVWSSLRYFHETQTYWTVLHTQLLFWNLAKPDNKCEQYEQIFIYFPQKSTTFTELHFMNSQTLTNICEKSSAWNCIKYEEIRRIHGQNLMYTLWTVCLPLRHFLQKLRAHQWHCMEILYRVIKKSLCTWWLYCNCQVYRDFLITLYNKFHPKWMKNIDNTGKSLIPRPN